MVTCIQRLIPFMCALHAWGLGNGSTSFFPGQRSRLWRFGRSHMLTCPIKVPEARDATLQGRTCGLPTVHIFVFAARCCLATEVAFAIKQLRKCAKWQCAKHVRVKRACRRASGGWKVVSPCATGGMVGRYYRDSGVH